jgi:lipopolysaccharide exporter
MGYTRDAFHGVSWQGLLKIITTLTTAGKIFVLARLLNPVDFGIFSLVAIALGLMESFTETGINTTIVQSAKSVRYFLDTAWVISIFRGFVIGILMILIGFGMKNFYQEEQLISLVAIAAFIPVIKGFINPAIVSLHKDLNFFKDALYKLALVVTDATAAILLALVFHSVWALILGMMVAAIAEVFISFWFFSDRPQFCFIKSRAWEIFHNAKSLNITAILDYTIQNVDNLLIGKLVGTQALGYYANGYSLSQKFNLDFSKSVQHTTFPIFTRMQNQKVRLTKAFLKSTAISLLLFICLSVPLIFFPHLVVTVVLGGEKWLAVEPILPLLAIAGLIQSFTVLSSSLLTAEKEYRWLNLALLTNVVTLIPLLFLLAPRFGLLGGVYAVVLSRVLTLPVSGLGIWKTLRR